MSEKNKTPGELLEAVKELSVLYKKEKGSFPDFEKAFYSISGIDKADPHSFVYVPLDSPYLEHIGSACGIQGNKIFSEKKIVDFLKEKNVKYILGIIGFADTPDDYKEGSIGLNSIALPIGEDDGKKFEEMVCEAEGSFRCEPARISGWTIYESE